jgi:carbon-monoxide dehydrogenase small subunit
MAETIRVTINGVYRELLAEPHLRLLDVLRDVARLTGTKEGCGTGDCGACTVILNGRAITSCCTLGVEADGGEITTVEGIARTGELHPVQAAFVEHGGLQCGFCTPGFIVSTYALLEHNPNPSVDEIKDGLAGNICRCTGYSKIIESVQAAAAQLAARKEEVPV